MTVQLTELEFQAWQASAEYRAGFSAGAESAIPKDVSTVQLLRPDGTVIATAVRTSTWTVVP